MKQKKRRLVPDAGGGAGPRAVEIGDVMTSSVIVATPERTVGEVRAMMKQRSIHSMPVVEREGASEPIGIVTSTDLLGPVDDDAPVADVMTIEVYTVPRYAGIDAAARLLRSHRIHHLVVTHEKQIVGVVSTFDLLQLLEGKRFVAKDAPAAKKRTEAQRRCEERS